MTAVPMEGKERENYWLLTSIFVLLFYSKMIHTYGKSKRSQDVDDLNAQVKVVEVLLKDSWKRLDN